MLPLYHKICKSRRLGIVAYSSDRHTNKVSLYNKTLTNRK